MSYRQSFVVHSKEQNEMRSQCPQGFWRMEESSIGGEQFGTCSQWRCDYLVV